MNRVKISLYLELIMYFSIIIALIMITPADIFSIIKSTALGLVIDLVLIKTKYIKKHINDDIKPIYIIVALLLGILIGDYFYETWILSSKLMAIGNIIGISNNVLLIIISTIGVIIVLPTIALIFSYYAEMGKDILCEYQVCGTEHKFYPASKCFLILSGINIFGIIAIIRANFDYIDDMVRNANGGKTWNIGYSRILSHILSSAIHMDNYVTDVSPLTQVIAAILMAFSGVLILIIICERVKFTMYEVLSVVSLCLNPYFLGCISFKFDSPYMALSILAGIIPLIYRNRNTLAYIGISTIGILVMCTTYQASSGIYPILVILIMLQMWNKIEPLKNIVMFCIKSVVGYGFGILIYRFFIMTPANDGRVSTSLPKLKEFIPNFVGNLTHYYKLIISDFKTWWLLIVLLVVICFLYTMVRQSQQNKIISVIMTSAAIICMGLLCFGMYPALEKPLFEVRAMYGFCVFITILGVYIASKSEIQLANVPILILGWTFMVFAFTYGNALSVQEEYTEYRIEQVINNLVDLEIFQNDKEKVVQISGDIGQSPILEAMPQDYQMLNRLIPSTFGGTWSGIRKFFYYYGVQNIVLNEDIDITTYNLPMLEEHLYYTIYGNDSYILIELK